MALSHDKIIEKALTIAENRAHRSNYITSPKSVEEYLILKLCNELSEVFSVVWLDTRHGVIEYQALFNGTIDGASVYPREVVKAGLSVNAAACVFCHNHPSGSCSPSQADKRITERLKAALSLIDIRVLDHVIVAGGKSYSFANNGLI